MIYFFKKLVCFLFDKHKWELVLCSKKFDKSLMVCRICGISWWCKPDKEVVGNSEYLKAKEIL